MNAFWAAARSARTVMGSRVWRRASGNPTTRAVRHDVPRATFAQLIRTSAEPDYAALDTILPHPVYAKQHWIAVLNPSRRTFDEILKPLLAEAHDRLASR